MTEIVKHKQNERKKGVKETVTKEDIGEQEEAYEAMIFEKEEQQIQQESDMNAQKEEIKKVEATILAFEKRFGEIQRENKVLDSELLRHNPKAISVTSKVNRANLNRISLGNGNSRMTELSRGGNESM